MINPDIKDMNHIMETIHDIVKTNKSTLGFTARILGRRCIRTTLAEVRHLCKQIH